MIDDNIAGDSRIKNKPDNNIIFMLKNTKLQKLFNLNYILYFLNLIIIIVCYEFIKNISPKVFTYS